ncbi:MAG: 3-deoxy-7-phosphoheptulonate synthase [candidate division Zixibacteria bacterium]|nr:3-deoxy-7-phosphoheptulonate synthase [candidate division Zixibacteria bacterium]
MVVVMKAHATEEQKEHVREAIRAVGCTPRDIQGAEISIICLIGETRGLQPEQFEMIPGVDQVQRIQRPFKLVSREVQPNNTVFEVGNVTVGGNGVVIIAGPCSVESLDQFRESAHAVKAAGGRMVRGGAFKPRTSPYSFQGLGEPGLKIMKQVSEETGLPTISEVMEPELVPLVADYIDVLQVGARNMQNYPLLNAVGKSHRPVMLKRGLSAKIEEMLLAAEYILAGGNHNVILCERGIRTFETWTRNTLDISAIPVLKKFTHLPVFIDPSQAVGHAEYVGSASLGSVAAGADGLIIEMHPNPEKALSDGDQSITPTAFSALMPQLRAVAGAVNRSIA